MQALKGWPNRQLLRQFLPLSVLVQHFSLLIRNAAAEPGSSAYALSSSLLDMLLSWMSKQSATSLGDSSSSRRPDRQWQLYGIEKYRQVTLSDADRAEDMLLMVDLRRCSAPSA